MIEGKIIFKVPKYEDIDINDQIEEDIKEVWNKHA
jgi:hypothetical protein